MNILTIDAAAEIEIVAVSSGDSCSDKTKLVDLSHSITLFDTIDSALKDLGITIHDIDCIGVGTGPGSFTGIRIAVSTARMLAQTLDIPLVGIATQLLYASSADMPPGTLVLPAFDAKKKRVFGALYKTTGDSLAPEEIIAPGDYTMEHIARAADTGHPLIAFGSGSIKYHEVIAEHIPGAEIKEDFLPSGARACRLIEKTYLVRPSDFSDFTNVLPNYARKSDAEVIKNLREKGQ
ncbi:MAG TPA: tRNA (adenosine(37)-N6)-threonylcarbamoyltransferase complex dimerization subunit type 1 TsaB [Spirochaetota bacterium]|nr:tRNA (adenosine(37)-N6)-threonylcarbamoyltransferase complex dimerization subunit type 1 TsaB [Spirochaetota bacterium]